MNINKVFRAEKESDDIVLTSTHAIRAVKSKDVDRFSRNAKVIIRNNENNLWVVATVQGDRSLKKNEITLSYDLAVELKIDMSATFYKTKKAPATVNLTLSKAGFLATYFVGLKSNDQTTRTSAILAIVGVVNLCYTVLIDACSFTEYVSKKVISAFPIIVHAIQKMFGG
ncbi:hypothetical protein V6259_18040 [Marinomonas sp. TI.3.20]|uniref:hypothetical protein n=1 Tax=Marinomonas sp. TI.3.20 TaxID=3121296 RepID=UPI00312052FE